MKTLQTLSKVAVGVLIFVLLLSASGNASTLSYSKFVLQNLQISSSADETMMDFSSLSSSTVSVSESGGAPISVHQEGYGNVQTANPYASAEAYMMPMDIAVDNIHIADATGVFIPDGASSPLEATASSTSLLYDSMLLWYFEGNTLPEEKNLTISFDYQSILGGSSTKQYGFFDSSLSVDITLRNPLTSEIIEDAFGNPVSFSLNDAISGVNSTILPDESVHRFEKELTLIMTDINGYRLDISVDAKAYASTEPTPEPSAILLLGSGLIAAFFVIRRKNS